MIHEKERAINMETGVNLVEQGKRAKLEIVIPVTSARAGIERG